MGQYDGQQVLLVAVGEFAHILHVGSLEPIDALVVVTYYKDIGLVPIADEQADQPVLGAAGILVFVDQDILIPFMVAGQELFVLFKGPNYPINHIVKTIPLLLLHQSLQSAKSLTPAPNIFTL